MSTVRRFLSKKERFAIFTRDNFTCQYCGRAAPDVVLHVDHYIPVAAGGPDVLWNFVTSCADCNLGKRHHFVRRLYLKKWHFQAIGIGMSTQYALHVKMKVTDVGNEDIQEELNKFYSRNGEADVSKSFKRTGSFLLSGKEYKVCWPFNMFSQHLNLDASYFGMSGRQSDHGGNCLEIFVSILEKSWRQKRKIDATEVAFIDSAELLGQGLLDLLSPGLLPVICWRDQ